MTFDAIDPDAARVALGSLRQRLNDALLAGVLLIVVAPIAYLLVGIPLVIALAVGGVLAIAIGLDAHDQRETLLARLVRQQSAYEIGEVWTRGQQLVSTPARRALGFEVTMLVLEAYGHLPERPERHGDYPGVRRHRALLIDVALQLCDPELEVAPWAAADIAAYVQGRIPRTPAARSDQEVSWFLRRVASSFH